MQPSIDQAISQLSTLANRSAINRANAAHSTGPRTGAGKQRSSQNALRHGLTSRSPVLRSEDPAAYERHCRQFHDEYQPKTPTEIQLVKELADTTWRLNRIPALEAELLDTAGRNMPRNLRVLAGISETTRALATLGLHAQRLSRQFNKALATLRDIQAERREREQRAAKQPTARPIRNDNKEQAAVSGFVFSPSESSAPPINISPGLALTAV